MRYKCIISFNGSNFYGYQKLQNKKTIQGELEKILTKYNKQPVSVKGVSRTDRGVHALNYVCHFDLNINIDCCHLKQMINNKIDKNIYVKSCVEVDENFHARFDAKIKTYLYKINIGEYDAINNDLLLNYNHKINIKKMQKNAKLFTGFHNFAAFCCTKNKNCFSIIYNIKITQKNNIINILIVGKTFYTYMIRNIIGALIAMENNKLSDKQVQKMLETGIKECEYETICSNGLYLMNVKY